MSNKAKEIIRKKIIDKWKNDSEYRRKVIRGVKKTQSEHPENISRGEKHSLAVGKGTRGKYKICPNNLFELSSRTIRKILVRMQLRCSICGWKEGYGDIHHINGKKIKNCNDSKNLAYVCPNCHRLIHEHKILKESLVNLFSYIGDTWKKFYYG